MNAKHITRNLNRKRYWNYRSSRRWAVSLYRMRWANFPIMGDRVTKLLDKVDA